MSYQISIVGADPEFGEPGFLLFHPAGRPLPTAHNYDPSWDYEPAEQRAFPSLLSVLAGMML